MKFSILLATVVLLFSCRKDNTPLPVYNYPELAIDSIKTLETNLPFDNYTDLTFVNETTGYAISGNGKIVKTINSGYTWSTLPSPVNFFLKKIQFTDSQTGYAIGGNTEGAYLLKTVNGGQSWTVKNLNATVSNFPRGMFFINNNTGFITGNSLFKKTTDGGNTFTDVATGDFEDVEFKNSQEGFATSTSGVYYKTIDGGASWQRVQTSSTSPFYDIYFTGQKVYLKNGNQLTDINSNTSITLPNGAFRFLFLNEEKSIAVGQQFEVGFFPYGYVYLTNDTWKGFFQKKYTTSLATDFKAIAKVNNKLTMMIGNGFEVNTVVAVSH